MNRAAPYSLSEAAAAAIAHYRQGDVAAAEAACRRLLAGAPDDAALLGLLGLITFRTGRFAEAIAAYRRLLARHDDLAAAVNLGNALLELGRIDEALAAYAAAARIGPTEPIVHANAAGALSRHGRHAEAAQACRRAAALAPERREVYHNLAVALQARGDFGASLPALAHALALQPYDAAGWNLVGIAHHHRGAQAEAQAAYRTALVVDPAEPQAASNLAALIYQQNRPAAAVAAYRRALGLDPASFNACNNVALALNRLGRPGEAIAFLRKAVCLSPELPDAWTNLSSVLRDAAQPGAARAAVARALACRPGNATADSTRLFLMNYDPQATPAAVAAAHAAWARRYAAPLAPAQPPRPTWDGRRRLRVGYVSADFWTHSVAFFFEPLLAAHDRTRVEVFCYADVKAADAVTERLARHAEHWRPIYGLDDAALCRRIAADGIDLLVDLAGHTADHRLLAFARKPAPVQATWLGYPNTTGLAAIDWRITDAIADPPPHAEAQAAERLMRLPGGFLCYRPPDAAPPVAPPPGRDGAVTFGSFNAIAKLNDAVLDAWARLLGLLPRARLLLKSKGMDDPIVADRLRAAFAARGVAPDRLAVAGYRGGLDDHLALYHQLDVGLDPFPYNGTTTTCEALWMGVPVVTLRGRAHPGRVGASLLAHAGLADLVAATVDDYVAIARDLALDDDRRAALRARARAGMAPLCDGAAFARRFEAALVEMAFLAGEG